MCINLKYIYSHNPVLIGKVEEKLRFYKIDLRKWSNIAKREARSPTMEDSRSRTRPGLSITNQERIETTMAMMTLTTKVTDEEATAEVVAEEETALRLQLQIKKRQSSQLGKSNRRKSHRPLPR